MEKQKKKLHFRQFCYFILSLLNIAFLWRFLFSHFPPSHRRHSLQSQLYIQVDRQSRSLNRSHLHERGHNTSCSFINKHFSFRYFFLFFFSFFIHICNNASNWFFSDLQELTLQSSLTNVSRRHIHTYIHTQVMTWVSIYKDLLSIIMTTSAFQQPSYCKPNSYYYQKTEKWRHTHKKGTIIITRTHQRMWMTQATSQYLKAGKSIFFLPLASLIHRAQNNSQRVQSKQYVTAKNTGGVMQAKWKSKSITGTLKEKGKLKKIVIWWEENLQIVWGSCFCIYL